MNDDLLRAVNGIKRFSISLLNNTRVNNNYGSFKKHQKRELFFPAFLHDRLVLSSLLGRRNYSARSFDMKDFVLKISLALILPGEAKGSKTLDLKEVEKFL